MGLRPDISIVVPDGPNAGLYLLDAKFKLQKLDSAMKDEEDREVETEERHGTFKRADLYKMHTYRDASRRRQWVSFALSNRVTFLLSLPLAQCHEHLKPSNVGSKPSD